MCSDKNHDYIIKKNRYGESTHSLCFRHESLIPGPLRELFACPGLWKLPRHFYILSDTWLLVFMTSQVPLSSKITFMYTQRAYSAPYHHNHFASSMPTLWPSLQLCYPLSQQHTGSRGHLWHLILSPPHHYQLPAFPPFLLPYPVMH